MKETPFLPVHRELGARLVDFAGYRMPVSYGGIIEEHRAVRSAVGLFDVSHMGELEVSGPGAADLVQRVTTNDLSRISRGGVQYSAMCTPAGGIVDDLLVYHHGDRFLLVVNASNREKDLEWIRRAAGGTAVDIRDRSDETALLAVQGPRSHAVIGAAAGRDLSTLAYYTWTDGAIAGVPAMISRTGYTGEAGYELYFTAEPAAARRVWDALMEAGAPHGIRPAGLGARDTLRLEMGYCLYGNDIDETTNPLEAGLGWITKLDKGEFVGREALQSVRAAGPSRRLAGFTLGEPRSVPRPDYPLMEGGREVGRVTSGTLSPTLDCGIGLGYLPASSASPGRGIGVMIRGREAAATTVRTPFVRSNV